MGLKIEIIVNCDSLGCKNQIKVQQCIWMHDCSVQMGDLFLDEEGEWRQKKAVLFGEDKYFCPEH